MKLTYGLVVTTPPLAPLYHTSVKTGSQSVWKQKSAGCIRIWNLSQGYEVLSKTLFTCQDILTWILKMEWKDPEKEVSVYD